MYQTIFINQVQIFQLFTCNCPYILPVALDRKPSVVTLLSLMWYNYLDLQKIAKSSKKLLSQKKKMYVRIIYIVSQQNLTKF
jgi:hypothetical protein